MTETLFQILLLIVFFFANSLEIFGFYAATRYGEVIDSISDEVTYDPGDREILWWVNYYGKQMIGEFWMKAVSNCPICMASLHSFPLWIIIYFDIFPKVIHFDFSFGLIFLHLNYILWLAGLNKLITSLRGIDL